LANTQSAPLFQSSPAFTQQPSSTPAFSSGNLFSAANTSSLFGSGPSLFTTPTFLQSAPAQTSSMFSFQPPPQPASSGGFPVFSNIANQALIGQQYDLLLLLSLIFFFLFSLFFNNFLLMV